MGRHVASVVGCKWCTYGTFFLPEATEISKMGDAMKKERIVRSIAELRALVRSTGLRSTGPRVAVLQQLQQAITPMSHAEIAAALEPAGLDRATLYRNLIDLTDAGLLSRTDHGDHVWRFELRDNAHGQPERHPHFTCIDCGEVECLPDASIEVSSPHRAPRAIRDNHFEVQLTGLCDRCAVY